MSILAQQNINNNFNDGIGKISLVDKTKWRESLGRVGAARTRGRALSGWGGYKFSPPGLRNELSGGSGAGLRGPRGKNLYAISQKDADDGAAYGPPTGQPLPNSTDPTGDDAIYSSVLTSLAWMIGKANGTPQFDTRATTPGYRMKETFTSGRKIVSLNNSGYTAVGHNDLTIPDASGGAVPGYQANNPYEITNWAVELASEKAEINLDGVVDDGDFVAETLTATVPIDKTGLRNIGGMRVATA